MNLRLGLGYGLALACTGALLSCGGGGKAKGSRRNIRGKKRSL